MHLLLVLHGADLLCFGLLLLLLVLLSLSLVLLFKDQMDSEVEGFCSPYLDLSVVRA